VVGVASPERRKPWCAARNPCRAAVQAIAHADEPLPRSFEVHFLAVARAWHGRGVGGGLVRFVEQVVALRSGRWLHVKPLAPSDPDADYARARMFLHEAGLCAAVRTSDDLGHHTPALILVKALAPATS